METLANAGSREAVHARPLKKRQLAADERQRATRACDEFRRLKEKCQGGVPCKRCGHLRRLCQISAPIAGAKRVSDSNNSMKELVNRSQYMECILKHHFPQLGLDVDSLRRTCASLPSTALPSALSPGEVSTAEAKQGHVLASDSPSIEDESCTIDYVDSTVAHYSGEFSHWNFSMHVKRNIDDLMADLRLPSPASLASMNNYVRVPEAHPNSTSISDIVAVLPPRPVTDFLTHVFFKHAVSFYFFVDRNWLQRMVSSMYNNAASLCAKDITAVCAAVMVLAVGTQYVHLESPVRGRHPSTFETKHLTTQTSWERDIGSSFYRQVIKLLSEVIHSGSLPSVQVCLLLGLYSLPVDASGLGYIYLNLAIKLAIQNGMHRQVSRDTFDPSTTEVRRRVWWTVYCMERKIGIYHGRPTSILRSDIDADLPLGVHECAGLNDGFDSSLLIDAIKLTGQAEASLREISLLRRYQRSDSITVLRGIKNLKTNMKTWPSYDYDITLLSTPGPRQIPPSRAQVHFRLECCLLEMFIGRPFLLVHRHIRYRTTANRYDSGIASQPPAPWPNEDNHGPTMTESRAQWNFLVENCIASAREAVELCQIMRTGEMGLAQSSYVEYSSCRAALLVLIAHSICYRTDKFFSVIQTGLGIIKEMASASDSTRSEVSLLEILEAALRTLHVFDPKHQEVTTRTEIDPSDGGYRALANWCSRKKGVSYSGNAPRTMSLDATGSGHSSNPFRDDISADIGFPSLNYLRESEHASFFDPEFGGHDVPEIELLENFLWILD
ncbi:hypothetical protein M3J09_010652 [Ascochyta lentis]